MHFSIDRTVHTTSFDKPVVDHWLERKITVIRDKLNIADIFRDHCFCWGFLCFCFVFVVIFCFVFVLFCFWVLVLLTERFSLFILNQAT